MLYGIEKNDFGEEYFLATLPEIWKLVYNKKKEMNLMDVKKRLERAEKSPVYVGEKGEQYYFIYRDKFGRYKIN